MNENLKRHRPDIKVLGAGKAIAFMPEDPMGVWVHIQEVRDLLDVKDRTIRDYEDNYLPRPKTMALQTWMIGSPETGERWVCDSEDVDKVIAEKNKEIEDQRKRLEEFENGALFNRENPVSFDEFAKICGFPLDSLENCQKEIEALKAKAASCEAKDKEIEDLKKKLAEYEDCAANACAERDDNQTAIDELTAENAAYEKKVKFLDEQVATRDKIIKDLTDERSILRKIAHDRKENYLEMQTKADRLEDKCLAKDGTIEELKASNSRLAKLVGKRSNAMLSFRKAMWKAIANWAKLEALRWLEREKACPLGSDREGFCMKRRHLWERVGDKGAYEVADYEALRDHLLTKYADAIASGKGIVTAEQPMRIIGK